MRVPAGFQVTLVASEPNIRQPLSISFDERGRMWVIQYLQYPNPAGLKAVSVDQYLRTKYDRVPEPPPRGPRGADRITICEDTDGDGVPDKFKDFISGLNLVSGMALGHGGVFLVQPPYLLFYADKNHDDVPDGDPEVLLSGFGMEDAHALANSLSWGPDGWLYGAEGSTVTSKIRGIEFQQGIWRYHPVTHEFELFAEGGGNTWGLDFDDEGEVIAGTNFGEVVGLHQVQGGYYVKGFAKHGPLHNAHTYGYFEHMPYTGWKGGRVITGGIIYHGGLLPASFEGDYIAGNLLRRSIDWHILEAKGSTFRSRYCGSFIETDDETFRPVDCAVGPDGAVYVADWCDARATHVDPVDNWDKDTGRIYRIAPQGAHPAARFDLAKLATDDLVGLLTNSNDWFRREARVLLAERHDTNVVRKLRGQALQTKDGPLALESLWALCETGGFDGELAAQLLEHPYGPVRAWTVRLLGDTKALSVELRHEVVALARGEKSARVRSQIACSAKRWPANVSVPIIRELLKHDEDVKDDHIPLLIWWAIEDKAISDPRHVLRILGTAADWNRPMVQTHILERLARRYASDTNEDSHMACAWLLNTAMTPEQRTIVLRGFDAAWQGQRAPADANLRAAFMKVWSPNDMLALRVGLRLGFAEAERAVLQRLTNAAAPDSERIALSETAGECQIASALPVLLGLLDAKPRVQAAAVAALQNFSNDTIGETLVARYPRLNGEARIRARSALVSRPGWAKQFVAAIADGKIDAKELSQDQLRQMLRHNDAALTAAIEKRWGRMQAQSSAEKISTINTLKLVLNPSGTTHRFKGDPVQGKKLFQQICGTCHKLFGEGNVIGPELTGSDRKNTDWLLGQIVDPSAFIRPEYVNHNVEMKDGRSLTGLIAEQSETAVTILDAQNQRTVLKRSDIKELAPSATSLMPEGLLEPLQPQQVRDLFSYLQGGGDSQVRR